MLALQHATANPFRSPEWRFSRVLRLTERREDGRKVRASWKYDDDYIKKFKQFLVQFRKNPDNGDWQQLFPEAPGMYFAWLIHTDVDELVRHTIQARVLARQSDEEIADAVCTSPQAVEWYVALFFDVRHRLRHRDWIVREIMGPASARGIDGREFDITAKLFGYFAGPLVLDVILQGFDGFTQVDDRANIPAYLDAQMALAVRRKSAMAALSFEVNRYNVVELFGVHTRLIELERAYETGGGVQSDYEQMIAKMTANLPFAVGSDARDQLAMSPLAPFQGLSAELRASDMLRVAAGTADPDLLERTRAKKLPPPRRTANVAGSPTAALGVADIEPDSPGQE